MARSCSYHLSGLAGTTYLVLQALKEPGQQAPQGAALQAPQVLALQVTKAPALQAAKGRSYQAGKVPVRADGQAGQVF